MQLKSVINRLTLPDDYPDKRHARMVENFREGVIAESNGELDQAYRIYMSVLKGNCPQATLYWERMAIMLERAGEYEKAIRVCDMALRLKVQHKPTANSFKQIFTKRRQRLRKKLNSRKK